MAEFGRSARKWRRPVAGVGGRVCLGRRGSWWVEGDDPFVVSFLENFGLLKNSVKHKCIYIHV